jgi:hypothetical protein
MDILPKEIENIIINYKYQIENSIKYKKCINQLKYINKYRNITYICYRNERDLFCKNNIKNLITILLKYNNKLTCYRLYNNSFSLNWE